MRAVVVKKPGPPDVLELVNDYPVPKLRDGEVFYTSSLRLNRDNPAMTMRAVATSSKK